MLRQRNTGKESREEVAMEKLVGLWWGQRVGRTEWQGHPPVYHRVLYLDKFGSTGVQIEGVNKYHLSLLQV